MAAHLGRPVDKVVLNYRPDETFALMSDTIWYNDEPIGGFSSIAHYLLMKRAAELKVTVLLSGQGADESLCGYRKYLGFYVQQLLRQGRPIRAGSVLAGFAKNRTVLSQLSFDKAKYYLPSFLRSTEVDISGPAVASGAGTNCRRPSRRRRRGTTGARSGIAFRAGARPLRGPHGDVIEPGDPAAVPRLSSGLAAAAPAARTSSFGTAGPSGSSAPRSPRFFPRRSSGAVTSRGSRCRKSPGSGTSSRRR